MRSAEGQKSGIITAGFQEIRKSSNYVISILFFHLLKSTDMNPFSPFKKVSITFLTEINHPAGRLISFIGCFGIVRIMNVANSNFKF